MIRKFGPISQFGDFRSIIIIIIIAVVVIVFAKIRKDRVGLGFYKLIFVVHEKSFVFQPIKTEELPFLAPDGFTAL